MLPHIAFIGRAGAGKSTAASLLAQHWGYTRLSFAAPLKRIAKELWGEIGRDRVRLQRLGVAVREIDPHTWIDLMLAEFETVSGPCVVDDCRFPNEMFALTGRGFVFVRIEADAELRRSRLLANGKWGGEESLRHESETALDDFEADYTIQNNIGQTALVDELARILDQEVRRT